MKTLNNPRFMWGCLPDDQRKLKFLDGMKEHWPKDAPSEGDTLVLPFIVDAVTMQPVPVTVVQTQLRQDEHGHLLVAVVTRSGQTH